MLLKGVDNRKLILGILALVIVSLTVTTYFVEHDEYSLMDIVKTKYNPQEGGNADETKVEESEEVDNSIVGEQEDDGEEEQEDAPYKVSKVSDFSVKDKLTLFPKGFHTDENELDKFYFKYFNVDKNGGKRNFIKYSNGKDSKKVSDPLDFTDYKSDDYHKHQFKVFTTNKDISDDMTKCNDIEKKIDVEITKKVSMDTDLESIVKRFWDSNTDYLKEYKPFFGKDIEKQFKEHTINQFWYRLAGTSVWLEQYGVHFMISRVLYSPRAVRNQPIISFTYGQIFNEKWEELKDVELVVPSNKPDIINNEFLVGGNYYRKIHYPEILPIPNYHDKSKTDNKYYGPEDPRILLVKNRNGFEEPMVIFNAHHRKITESNEIDDNNNKVHYDYFRSMFMCWPWQFQTGKRNVDEFPDGRYDLKEYLRVSELKRKGFKRVDVQKNWTPFIDFTERESFTFDKYIYFVYRWADFEVLKCDLANIAGPLSNCEFEYKMVKDLGGKVPVGPLRGGTELFNINALVNDYAMNKRINLPQDKQVFIGFARAHIKDCGCGQDIYRPNLVVVLKDKKTGDFKIDVISSFVSLDVQILGWDLNHPNDLCLPGHPNILIPNGISSWSLKPEADSFTDYLTLTFSLTDATVDAIHIKGVLKSVINLINYSGKGFDNDNVNCALESSKKFCSDYGKEQSKSDNNSE